MRTDFGSQEITFDSKPSAEIRSALKANGFRWSPSGGRWYYPGRGHRCTADFVAALERIERRDLGLPPAPDGECWTCKAPQGFFRHHAAGTPVLCDACHVTCAFCAEQKRLRSPNAEVIIRDPGEDAADRWNESYR
jgi:hypothetical protein